jgi:hypothetical protein
VVDHSAHNPKIKGSNPATGTGGEKMVKNYKLSDLAGRFYTSESFCNLLKAKMKNGLGLLFSILRKKTFYHLHHDLQRALTTKHFYTCN